jgi:hypothetical protein
MTQPTITRIWLGGLVAIAVGLVIAGIGVSMMLTNGGTFTPAASGSGYDFFPRLDSYFWTTVTVTVIGGVVALVGGTAQLTALIGALVNTYRLSDRTWFVVLLVGGLIGLTVGFVGFAVMAAYVIAGPDALAIEPAQVPPTPAPPPWAPPPAPYQPPAPEQTNEHTGTLVPMS